MTERIDPGHLDLHEELAVGWVLHTLEPEDQAEFVLHLADCPRCADAVAEAEATVGLLGAAVVPVDPPPALRRRLLDAVAEDVAEDVAAGETTPDADAEPATGDVVPLASRRRRASRVLLVAAAAAAVALVAGLAIANQQLREERDARAAAAAENARVIEVLRDAGTPGVAHASLADPQGTMVGLVVDRGSSARLLATGLQANRTDQIYVLWGLAGDQPVPLGTFDVTDAGPVVSSVPSGPEASPYGGFAVSLEPGRTAPASPTRVVASGQVGR